MKKLKDLIPSGRVKQFDNEEKWLVDIGILRKSHSTGKGDYIVDDIPGITDREFGILELLYGEKELSLEEIAAAIKAKAIFRIIDEDKNPGWAILIPVKTSKIAKRIIENIREETKALLDEDYDEDYNLAEKSYPKETQPN